MLKVLMEKVDTMKTQMGNISWEIETIRKNQDRGKETGFKQECGQILEYYKREEIIVADVGFYL